MVPRRLRYYRHLAGAVLRWYAELEDGLLPGGEFEANALNFRVDVDLVLKRFSLPERAIALAIHRDGLSQTDAVARSGWSVERPDHLVADIEFRMGLLFEQRGLANLQRYLQR